MWLENCDLHKIVSWRDGRIYVYCEWIANAKFCWFSTVYSNEKEEIEV